VWGPPQPGLLFSTVMAAVALVDLLLREHGDAALAGVRIWTRPPTSGGVSRSGTGRLALYPASLIDRPSGAGLPIPASASETDKRPVSPDDVLSGQRAASAA